MIQKLRRKFILINMLLVSMVLLTVFAVLFYSSYQRLQRDSVNAMNQIMEQSMEKLPPKFEIGVRRPRGAPMMTPVLCAVIDTQGKIVRVTEQNVQISDELLAQAVEQVLDAGNREGVIHSLDLRYLRQETPEGTKIAFADRSFERESLNSLLVSSLLVGMGGLTAFFIISLFLSRWALRPVEQAWERQRQFVADASHELKTPLTVILANTNILLAHRDSPIEGQIKWVEYTQVETIRMKQLVDNLLFLARSDSNQTPLLQKSMNLSDVVWSSLLPYESIAYEQGITLNSEIDSDVFLVGDEGQIKQLVVILLDNACKYAEEKGTVTLTLKQMQTKIKLTVHNTGCVIPAEHLEHIFERFYRLDESRVRRKDGYGLGLSIARTIVENHQGKITAESLQEKGTSLLVVLPCQA